MIYSSRVLALISCILLCGCSSKKNEPQKSSEVQLLSTTDTCKFCRLKPFLIEPSNGVKQPKKINFSVAIVYLNRADTAGKYFMSRQPGAHGILKKRLGLSSLGQVHSILEQRTYYNQVVKPELIKENVVILDTVSRNQFIEFEGSNESYSVDLKPFSDTDGIIMFKPGKEPIFWTMDKVANECSGYEGNIKWYYSCGY